MKSIRTILTFIFAFFSHNIWAQGESDYDSLQHLYNSVITSTDTSTVINGNESFVIDATLKAITGSDISTFMSPAIYMLMNQGYDFTGKRMAYIIREDFHKRYLVYEKPWCFLSFSRFLQAMKDLNDIIVFSQTDAERLGYDVLFYNSIGLPGSLTERQAINIMMKYIKKKGKKKHPNGIRIKEGTKSSINWQYPSSMFVDSKERTRKLAHLIRYVDLGENKSPVISERENCMLQLNLSYYPPSPLDSLHVEACDFTGKRPVFIGAYGKVYQKSEMFHDYKKWSKIYHVFILSEEEIQQTGYDVIFVDNSPDSTKRMFRKQAIKKIIRYKKKQKSRRLP